MLGFQSFEMAVQTLFWLAVGVAGTIFIIMLLVGGVQYLTSMGNEDATTKAKKLLINAVIGIVIVAIAAVAGRWILTQIGLIPKIPIVQ